jgi:cell division protein FtsW
VGVLLLALAALVAVFVPGLGVVKNGARRWVNIGLPVGFQPSEFVKVGLCIWVAAYCERNLGRIRSFAHGFLVPLGVVGLACTLILLEPDFGTAVLTGLVCVTVMMVMGTRLLFLLLAGAACLPFLHQLVFEVPYRLRRVLAFLDPWADPRGAGYQLIQSLVAIGSGGTTGLGLGAGRQKADFLPGARNDFIFSVVGEELGFIGCVAVILLMALLLWECLKVVKESRDPFGFGLALGLTTLLGVQATAHIAVATGCVPTKGLSLPFISAGGSSLLASMLAAGILVNIARSQERPDEFDFGPPAEDEPCYERAIVGGLRGLARFCHAVVPASAQEGGDRLDAS